MVVNKNELPLILSRENISEIMELKEAEANQDRMFPVIRRGKRIIRIPRDPFFKWLECPNTYTQAK